MIDEIKKTLKGQRKAKERDTPSGLSTGCSMVNLAFSGQIDHGILPGKYYLLVGDSASGKTFLSLSTMAEAAYNKQYDEYRLIYDDVEGGALMDMEKFFGKLSTRIEVNHSSNVEEFFDGMYDDLKGKSPFIRVLDSSDALDCAADQELYERQKAAREKGKKVPASYGAEKAKQIKQGLRRTMRELEDTGSILMIICQTIDRLDAVPFGEKKTRAGGRALKFFAAEEAWFSIRETIKKEVNGRSHKIGSVLQIQVRKNRQTGWEPSVCVPFYPSLGFDNTGSCVDFLIEEGEWKKEGRKINAGDFGMFDNQEDLIDFIESNDNEQELFSLVQVVWKRIEEACKVFRKPRYS
jgi:RecA/RadA recombinase